MSIPTGLLVALNCTTASRRLPGLRSPELQNIRQRLLQRDLWRPTELPQARAVSDQLRRIQGAELCLIGVNSNWRGSELQHDVKRFANAAGLAGTQVVHFPGVSLLRNHPYRANGIPDVDEISDRR